MQLLRLKGQQIFAAIIVVTPILGVAGCGGNLLGQGTTPAANNSQATRFANQSVTGTVALDAGKTGTLALTTSSDGSAASGTLTVTAPQAPANRVVSFTVGVHAISGNVDPATGTFSINANIAGVGPFSISGTLPTSTAAGAFQIIAQGNQFNGTLPVPTGGGNNGGGNNGGSGFGALTVSERTGNPEVVGNSLSPTGTEVDGRWISNATLNSNVLSVVFSQMPATGIYPVNSVLVRIHDFDGALTANESYSAETAFLPNHRNATVTVTISVGVGAFRSYTSHGGTVKITALSNTSATILVDNVLMKALPGDVTGGRGSFELDGTFTFPVTVIRQ